MTMEKWNAGTQLLEAVEAAIDAEGDMKRTARQLRVDGDGTICVSVLVKDERMEGRRDGYISVDKQRFGSGLQDAAFSLGYAYKGMCFGVTPRINEILMHFDFKKELRAKIITTQEVMTTWEGIQNAILNGDAKSILKERDRIPFKLTNGTKLTAVVAAISGDRVCFVVDECFPDAPMYHGLPENESVSWSGSDRRTALNTDTLSKLPPELEAVIIPRVIKQRIDGKVVITEDKLWSPSFTEIFGVDEDGNPYPTDGEDEFHFPIFADERDRVKQVGGVTTWWWLRSPDSGSSTSFRYVFSSGNALSDDATTAGSVCFGFCIGR